MSKVSISGNASGTGTFSIVAPNSNNDRTLVLPDEAGTVLTSGTPLSSFPTGFANGITQADQWRLSTNSPDVGTGGAVITAGWERADDATSGIIGTGMSESSGVFTFPETGIYQVMFSFCLQARNGNNAQALASIDVSTDTGSSFDRVARAETEIEVDDVATVSVMALVDVTNSSTFQVQFEIQSSANDVRALGSTTLNRTTVSFIRLGDT